MTSKLGRRRNFGSRTENGTARNSESKERRFKRSSVSRNTSELNLVGVRERSRDKNMLVYQSHQFLHRENLTQRGARNPMELPLLDLKT